MLWTNSSNPHAVLGQKVKLTLVTTRGVMAMSCFALSIIVLYFCAWMPDCRRKPRCAQRTFPQTRNLRPITAVSCCSYPLVEIQVLAPYSTGRIKNIEFLTERGFPALASPRSQLMTAARCVSPGLHQSLPILCRRLSQLGEPPHQILRKPGAGLEFPDQRPCSGSRAV